MALLSSTTQWPSLRRTNTSGTTYSAAGAKIDRRAAGGRAHERDGVLELLVGNLQWRFRAAY